MNRQFDFYMKHKTAMKNNLIENLSWVLILTLTVLHVVIAARKGDFASTYRHVDCVRKMSRNAFINHYQNWCKRKKCNFIQSKAEEIYGKTKELVPVLLKDEIT